MNNCIAVIYLPYLVVDIHMNTFIGDRHTYGNSNKKVNATYGKIQKKKVFLCMQ